MDTTEINFTPIVTASSLIGFGMGGILDSILFQHLFQIHQIVSVNYPPSNMDNVATNTFWTGLFLVICWAISIYGIIMQWKALLHPYTPRSHLIFTGSYLAGWGLYIFIEGSVLHLLLRYHHVIDGLPKNQEIILDLGWTSTGLLIMIIGKFTVTKAKRIFYAQMIKTSSEWDPLSRPPCPTPYQEYQ